MEKIEVIDIPNDNDTKVSNNLDSIVKDLNTTLKFISYAPYVIGVALIGSLILTLVILRLI